MKIIKTSLILTILLNLASADLEVIQNCSKGCLKCSKENKCLLCDTSSNYYLSTDFCLSTIQQNCSLINITGDCKICKKGFWLDINTKKCVLVDTKKLIENCLSYDSSQNCMICEKNFFLQNNKCLAVTVPINLCEEYKTDTICGDCQDGFFLSSDEKKCEIIPNLPSFVDCHFYSRYKCESCKAGFFLNQNLYFNKSFKTSSITEKEDTLSFFNSDKKNSLVNNDVCQKITVKNCKEYETYDLCKSCNPNYYLKEDKKCSPYPKPIISNCSKYSSNTKCIECNQGYFLSSSTECKKVTNIENCSTYSQSSDITNCIKCNREFYLSSTTSCTPRNFSALTKISNCITKSINSDKCSLCDNDFILSSDGLECVLRLTNCSSHSSFSSGITPSCSVCDKGFYLKNTDTCEPGTDYNCEIFIYAETCSKCKNKFFHNGTSACEPHINNSNCLTYSDSTKNTCLICENHTFNFLIQNKCNILTAIDNCLTYNHENSDNIAKCEICANKYYVSSDGYSCILIEEPACAKVNVGDSNKCIECDPGYNLFVHGSNTECVFPHDIVSDNCNDLSNLDLTNTGLNKLHETSCNECKVDCLPIDNTNNFACINNKYLKADSIGILEADIISGCLKYDEDKCTLCESSKYLKSDQTVCLDACPNTKTSYAALMPVLNTDNDASIDQYNICRSQDTTSEKLYGPNVKDAGTAELLLLTCMPNSLPIVSTLITIGTAHKSSNVSLERTSEIWVQDIKTVNPKLEECQDLSEGFTLYDVTTTINTTQTHNCEYYSITGDPATAVTGCTKCKHQYSAKANEDSSVHLDSSGCTLMGTCSSTKYGNIPVAWSKFFSCHKCNSANEIPYLMYDFDDDDPKFTAYLQYDLLDATSFVSGDNNKTIECLNNVTEATFQSQIGDTGNATTVTFVENCGLGLFDISVIRAAFDSSNIADTDYTTLSSAYCAACKPGYKPTIRDPHTVKLCTEIQHCSNSTWFNACSECNYDYAFDVDGGDIDYTKCVENSDPNCFAASATTKCSFCKKGYTPNKDGFCVIVNTPHCEDKKFVPYFKVDNSVNPENLSYLYWYSEQGAGCNECNFGFTAVKYESSKYPKMSCAVSRYIPKHFYNFPNNPEGDSSVYINNCLNYKVVEDSDSPPVCTQCSGNLVLRENGSECIGILNCVTALDSSNGCKVCAKGYGLTDSGNCLVGRTLFCATYNTSQALPTARCLTCNEEYYLTSTNKCEKGAVANCKIFGNSAKRCETCKDGYFLILNNLKKGDYDYCYKFDESLHCSVVNITPNNIGVNFDCTKCSVGNSVIRPLLTIENQSNCLGYNQIKNCEIYDVGNNLNSSSFSCSLCKTGYYHTTDGLKCVKRTLIPRCLIYQINDDLCSSCNDLNFLSVNKKECNPYPSGKIGCITYSDATTCTACGADTWLNEGACTNIETDDKVENCLYYLNATTCSTCQPTYFLENENKSCVIINVENCLTYKSKDACETCLPNHRLKKTEEGLIQCEPFNKEHCKTFDQSGTNPCLECNHNYYINVEGNCVVASPIIENCLINSSIDECSTCEAGFALSIDKKSCLKTSLFDNNCKVVNMPKDLDCSQCKPNYYFKNGLCEYLGGVNSKGCFTHDFNDHNVCLICNEGYYMDSSLKCVEIKTPIDNKEDEEDEQEGSFEEILRRLIFVIIGFVFVF